MKTVILAGGLGTRISEESHLRPKPMIEIGGHPGHLRCVEWEAAGLRLRQLVGLTTVGPDAYAVVCTVHSSDFEALEPLLRSLIEGVEIAERDPAPAAS